MPPALLFLVYTTINPPLKTLISPRLFAPKGPPYIPTSGNFHYSESITSGDITQVSNFPPTRYIPQCATVIFLCQHTVSCVGTEVPNWT